MAYLVGSDEAGYGPNLGPLVISVTIWQAPEDVGVASLFDQLAQVVARRPQAIDGRGGPCVAMADSKMLYSPERGLKHLEQGLWAAL